MLGLQFVVLLHDGRQLALHVLLFQSLFHCLLSVLLLLLLLAAEHIGIECGGQVQLVVALVIGEP